MRTIVIVLIVAVAVIGGMIAVLSLKMMMHREKEYRRPCANADPQTGRCAHCTCDKPSDKQRRRHA